MKGTKLNILIAVLAVIFAMEASGQRPGGSQQRPPNVSGVLTDDDSGEPIEFATISVLNVADSSLVTGVVTSSDGRFEISVKPGSYVLRAQFITYATKEIPVEVAPGKPVVLNDLTLGMASKELAEVVVQGERTQMELKLDKKVYNVGKDLSNLGGSASDILGNLPSVAVDVEGNISLRGSTNVRILVDGKPSGLVGMSSADALRQLQGNLVERVEIVTNPSARYDAEGSAGIINIVLKKEKAKGINGSFQLNTGYPHNHGGSFNINFRRDWVNLFANVGVGYRKAPGIASADQIYEKGDSSWSTTLNRDMFRGGISYNARSGADFYLGDNTTLTAYFLYRFSDEDNNTVINYYDTDQVGNSSRTNRDEQQLEDDKNLEYGFNFVRNFKGKGHKLTADFQFQNNNEQEYSDLVENFGLTEASWVPQLYQRSETDEGEERMMFQADYNRPFGQEGSLEAGSRISLRNVFNYYIVENQEDGEYVLDQGLSNDFNYLENIYAFYGIYNNKTGKVSYQLGARVESTDIETALVQTNETNVQKYTNFFPSAFLTYDLTETHKLQLSYSRRVRRPRFRSLNPFFSISDSRNYWSGNPNLKPVFTDSYELGYLQNFNKSSVYYGVYYRHSIGVTQRITTITEDGIRIRRPENLGFSDSYGFEMNASHDFVKWYRISGNANLFYFKTEGTLNEGTADEQFLSAEALSFMTRVSNNLKIGDNWTGQANFFYRAPQESPQGKRLAMTGLDLGLSRDVLNQNGTISFSARDVFNSRKYRGIAEIQETANAPYYYEESTFQWRSRQFTVQFIYRLNQKKQRERGGRGEGGGMPGDDGGF
ncbi:MAG: TonB-dependent receptor [Cyclobacteriaceae bacterium]